MADLALSVARIWLDVVHSMTRRTLGMLEKDLALEDEVTDHKYETRVEEATGTTPPSGPQRASMLRIDQSHCLLGPLGPPLEREPARPPLPLCPLGLCRC